MTDLLRSALTTKLTDLQAQWDAVDSDLTLAEDMVNTLCGILTVQMTALLAQLESL